jgi:glutathione-regulated potassium-efflux system ancillary protein KefG
LSHAEAASRPGFAAPTVAGENASVLVLFAHPVPHRSRVNHRLVGAIRGMRGVTLHDLYEAYPDFAIDVEFEQELLLKHDIIVLQHPFYWYSTPALLKEWQDHVLSYGWAYGRGGTALTGKRVMSAITTGGPTQAYQRDVGHGFTVLDLLAPLVATTRLCHMTWLPPFVVSGTHRLDDPGLDKAAADYRRVIEALRDGRLRTVATPDGRLDADRAAPAEGEA